MAGARLPYLWNDEYGARIGLLPLDGPDGDRRRRRAVVRHRARATSSTRSTPTTSPTARRARRRAAPEDVRPANRLGPERGPAAPRAVDDRPGRGQGRRGDPRRPAPGVPAPQRDAPGTGATATATASTARAALAGHGTALKHDLVAGTTDGARLRPGPHDARAGVRAPRGRDRRGRRLGAVLRLRRDDRPLRRRGPRRPGLHRRPRRHGPPARPRARTASTATGCRRPEPQGGESAVAQEHGEDVLCRARAWPWCSRLHVQVQRRRPSRATS